MRYEFCPKCGSKLIPRDAGDDGQVPFCEKCSRYWFDSFANCVLVMVVNDQNEIALCKQNYLSEKYETFTSGFISPGENAEETAIREVREELGLDIERLEYSGTVWFGDKDMLMHAFIGFVKKADFHLSSEVDAAEWARYDMIKDRIFPDRPGNAMWVNYRHFIDAFIGAQDKRSD